MRRQLANILKLLAFLAVGLTILYFLYQSQNTAYLKDCATKGIPAEQCDLSQKLRDDFTKTNPIWIILIVLTTLLSHLLRALRWNMLIKPLGAKPRIINSFFSVIIGFFANLGIPRVGELVRATTLSKYEKIPTEKLFGTVVVDRIVDMVTFMGIIGLAFLLEFKTIYTKLSELYTQTVGPAPAETSYTKYYILGALALIGIGFLYYMFKNPHNLVVRKIKSVVSGIVEGITTIKSLEKPWMFLFYTLMIWLAYYVMLCLTIPAFEPTNGLGLRAALIIFVFGSLGFIFPSPGGMGTYHWLVIQALLLYNISEADGFSFANIAYFSGQIFSNVVFGIIALILLPIINLKYHPRHNLHNDPA